MPISNLGLQGRPTTPYIDVRSFVGADVFIALVFLDHTMTQVEPTAIQYELDDITNVVNMVPPTTITPSATVPQTLQIPGSVMQLTYPWQGSQLCQIKMVATVTDSVTGNPAQVVGTAIIELVAIQTPTGY